MLRSIEKRRDDGEERHFREAVAAFKHLRNQNVEESLLRVYTLEPDKLGFDSSFYVFNKYFCGTRHCSNALHVNSFNPHNKQPYIVSVFREVEQLS